MRLGVDEVGRGAIAGPLTLGFVATGLNFPLLTHNFGLQNSMADFDYEFENSKSLQDLLWLTKVFDSKQVPVLERRLVAKNVFATPEVLKLILSASNLLIKKYGLAAIINHTVILGLHLVCKKTQPKKLVEIFLDGNQPILQSYNLEILQEIFAENHHTIKTLTGIEELKFEKQNDLLFESQLETGLESLLNFDHRILKQPKADCKYFCVAAASVIAKQFRDCGMQKLHLKFPNYGWNSNVGYATKHHLESIKWLGKSCWHR